MGLKMIRGWRIRGEGPGCYIWFDPTVEHVTLHEGGMEVAYEIREGREAGEAGAMSAGLQTDCFAECEISAKSEGSHGEES